MRVLVTGGTGVVGRGAVEALISSGHQVRLLSRHAGEEAAAWPQSVESFSGSVTDRGTLIEAMRGCEAVLHIAGIVHEAPPEVTFESVNVNGTRNTVDAAQESGIERLVFVSSLGADRGASDYHRSKLRAEDVVRRFAGNWTIVRPGNVYGPGDEVISLLLKMVRTLPAVPVISHGDQPFEPLWYEDLGRALALTVERSDLAGRIVELAGPDRTSMNDLIERLSRITGRSPVRIPIPQLIARLGARAARAFGVDPGVDDNKLTMLEEGNVIEGATGNSLITVFGIEPTPLDEGLERLADLLPEQLPSEGVGDLHRKMLWAEIEGSRLSATELFREFLDHFEDVMLVEFGSEPGTPSRLERGATLTGVLPLRGHFQVRVEEVGDHHVTLATLEGHPLAGIVRFSVVPAGQRIRFEVTVYDRAADWLDLVAMSTVGGFLQNRTWDGVVERVVERSGGTAPGGVQRQEETVDDEAAGAIEAWAAGLVQKRRRDEIAFES